MKKKMNARKTAVEIGAGLVAASAAAAAGYYFYGSKSAKSHRKIAAKWAADMKKEVMRETQNLKRMTPEAFAAVVDRVAKTYQTVRSVDATDVRRAAKELKANREVVRREMEHTIRKSAVRAKAMVKRAVRKNTPRAKK